MFNSLFIWLTGQWFKPKPPVSLIPEGGYSLQEIPIGECSHDLGLNDNDETASLKIALERSQLDLEALQRRVDLLNNWYENFEDLSYWMLDQELWGAEDVDENNPMMTYKNGLTRFLKKHNIPIK